jgi:ABC-type polysaccharide/polyol phosphate export permease
MGYFQGIWRLHHFWMALVRNDLRNRYRRSMIGLGWSLLQPICMTIILCTVFAGIMHIEVRKFGPFLISGLVTWNFIVSAITGGCQSFLMGEPYIRQHPAPLAIYPLRSTLGAGIHFLLGLTVALALTWYMNGFANLPALVGLLPTLLLLFILGWMLGICMGVVNVMFQDTQHLVEVALQILFYLTPIMYEGSLLRERGLGWVFAVNPMATFVELIRQPILDGVIPSLGMYAIAAAITATMALIATLTLCRMERRLIFYL